MSRRDQRQRHVDGGAQMLIDGPENMLLAGVGFMEGRRAAAFDSAAPAEQAAVLADMQAAWKQHGARLIAEHRAEHGLAAALWAEGAFGGGRTPSARAAPRSFKNRKR